jgi:AcrR family transcriptional regulator
MIGNDPLHCYTVRMNEPGAIRRRTAAETREHLLRVAHDLFYWNGIHAVGVDRLAAEAEVAPTTLYRQFASKDDLVAAYVERASTGYREWFTEATRAGGRGPRERILALFDALAVQIQLTVQDQPDHCRGCPFMMTLAETPDAEDSGPRHAVALKRWVRDRLRDLVDELAQTTTVPDPALLADQLTLILEGTYASVQALGVDGPARHARATAEAILPTPRASGPTGSGS